MERTFSWRPGVLAALALTLLALLPQVHLWYARGGDWQGAYASFDGDETAYAAYLAALIEGRPRLNDPYAGLDHAAEAQRAESLFSIQFVPPYALALVARALGLDASTVFVALTPLVAFAVALALFWLLVPLVADARVAACGVVVILCFGTLASGEVSLALLVKLRASYAYLPFLRRYVPALPFPFLFIFCALVWRALAHASRRASLSYAVAAGATFALLVYSYFYLWTTAAAWLACLALLRLAARRSDERTRDAGIFLTTGALACASLVPYALLVARRAPTMDAVQVLQFTRAPDLFRAPEIISLAALVLLAAFAWRGRLRAARDATFLYAASFALTPFVVFNQQLLTGRSLQPVHYADYVLNYLALLALVLAVALCLRHGGESDPAQPRSATAPRGRAPVPPRFSPAARGAFSPAARAITSAARAITSAARAITSAGRRFPARVFLCVALAAYVWAAFELAATTRRFAPVNRERDEQARVASRLAEMAREDAIHPASADAYAQMPARPVVLATSFMLADNLPVGAPRTSVLWAPHMHVYSGLTADEHKERMYQLFYYTGVAPENLRAFLDANPLVIYKLFGAERVLPRLTTRYAPLTAAEVEREREMYAAYVAAFTRAQAARPALSFVVTSPERAHDLSQLDRWYERDAGERVGRYTIHRVRLRP
jgi:hypothetical protein